MIPMLVRWSKAFGAVATVALALLLVASASAIRATGINQTDLKSRLASNNRSSFIGALNELATLDEPDALDIWQTALDNPDPALRREAWRRYRPVQVELRRKRSVPQVARVFAPQAEVLRVARESALDATIWSASAGETIVAAPPYLIERLTESATRCDVLYDTIADWDSARSRGDALADAITPEYLSATARSRIQSRVAVIDLSNRTRPAAGYSDWLGDRENILVRDGTRIAYLDSFESDGSRDSIAAHIDEQYTRRGYRLSGFYTQQEFARVGSQFFPGKDFSDLFPPSFRPYLSEGAFHSYDETASEFRAIADNHPDLAAFVKLGTSYEGRSIFALKISRNAQGDDPTKPEVLITGCHHAREWISVEAPVYFANQLVKGYSTDDSIKFLVDNLQIWIVPIVNPDGLTYSQGSSNDQTDAIRTWRKNRRPFSFGGCLSSVGVDLNRNYSFQWRLTQDSPCADYCSTRSECTRDDVGASDDPSNELFRGPSAASEPEVQALKSLIDDPSRRFRAQIDYHNYAQLVLYPWGFENNVSPDSDIISNLAARISDGIRSVNNKIYRPEQAIDLYPTTGSSIDYSYGLNHVPAPFVVEMRPECCFFNVPESDIPAVNQENWAGARAVFDWAAGPPILQSVKAYTRSSDGTFSNLVYSARWVTPTESASTGRTLIVDTRFGGIEPGPLLVRTQFSKPMNDSLPPHATLGRGGQIDELRLVAVGSSEGWQQTVYPNDTWIGETVISQSDDLSNPWGLAVSAADTSGLNIDALPGTVADYGIGTGHWRNYEDANGEGSDGGVDLNHTLAPTLGGDFPVPFVASPSGGERLAGGDILDVSWTLPASPSFNPVAQLILLSTDGGVSFDRIADGLPGGIGWYQVTLPRIATARARVRVEAIDGLTGNATLGDSLADFTIGANIGSAIDASLVSAEKLDVGWSEGNGTLSGSSRFVLNLTITNHGSVAAVNPFIEVPELSRDQVLLSRDPGSPPGEGARQSIDAGSDQILSPGESVQVRLVVGLLSKKKFKLSIDTFGVPQGGQIPPGSSVRVWSGKPKST